MNYDFSIDIRETVRPLGHPAHDAGREMLNTRSKRNLQAALLVLTIGIVSLLHYNTPTTYYWAHPLLQRAYYIPILLMALWFGWRGGISAAALAALSYLPHIAMAWRSHPEYRVTGYVEMGMFFVIATLTGVLADQERSYRRKIEESAGKLSHAYQQLHDSVEQLRRADRLSALGELSAGLAHEIRNPLGSLDGAVQILRRPQLPESTRHEFATMAEKEVSRLNTLLTNFLEFARPNAPQRMLVEPGLLLEAVAQLAGETARMAGSTIRILPGHAPAVFADAEQIKQVLLNLILNAVQAMPSGGEIVLRSCQENGSVLLQVADQGVGIAEQNLERIFDPFFTTRAGGTGLGLSIAYQIVHGHGGHLSVRNNSERGVTFTIFLPVSQPEVAATVAADALA
jgi:two-component system, NtrC family, sensor histidine kinase HydH